MFNKINQLIKPEKKLKKQIKNLENIDLVRFQFYKFRID